MKSVGAMILVFGVVLSFVSLVSCSPSGLFGDVPNIDLDTLPTEKVIDPQSSPVSVVQSAIKARAEGDQESFNSMVIDDREFLWEKIKKCEGKNPKFEYVEGTLSYMGQTYITVEIFDGKSENGGFAVKKIGSKWYLEDWLGEVYCSD